MAVAFHAGFLQAVGHFLALDDAQRNIGTGLAAGLQFADAVADFIQNGTFVQTFPGGDETDSGYGILVGLIGGFEDGFGVNEAVFRRAGLVMGGLRAEAAILGAGTGLGIDDGAEMNLVALELFANAVGPREEVQNVGGAFEMNQPQGFIAGDMAAPQNSFAQEGDLAMIVCVNLFRTHD